MPESEAIVLVKAAPQPSQTYNETVCCAGVTLDGEWLRLYPVTFRRLDDAKKFGRWHHIRFRWRFPTRDSRPESRQIEQESIEILGKIESKKERHSLLDRIVVTGLDAIRKQGKSFALLRPQNPRFLIEKKEPKELEIERKKYEDVVKQSDMFQKQLIPLEPCPYRFKYSYQTDDGKREGTCQDWETSATYFNWKKLYGEKETIERIQKTFGEDYPAKGMVFAMGTHSQYPDTWLINGIIRMDETSEPSLALS